MRSGQTPADVAAALRGFLEGTGGDWDWDDFTSLSQADPRLDSIRRRAAAIDLPLDPGGRQALEALLSEAETLIP